MADPQAQDRNLPASQRKLRKAREDGQVARSRDLGHFATIGAGSAALAALAPTVANALERLVQTGLRFDAQTVAHGESMLQRLAASGVQMLWLVLPLGLLMIVVAFAVARLAGGWVFSRKPLGPDFSRVNPLTGLTRLFSKQQLIDTLKACTLALVLGAIGATYLKAKIGHFGAALSLPLPVAIGHAAGVLASGFGLVLLALAAFAAVDVPLQRQLFLSRMKMSHREAKQEHKEQEGNVEVKGRIKARMREIAKRRMLAAVPDADLVVMNPTHYAVALRYDEATMAAPRVVAKGADLLALRIRDIAKDANVPVLQAAPLARALYAHAPIDQEVPPALFAAVAQVLAYVYQLRAAWQGRAAEPAAMPEIAVPPELDPHVRAEPAGADE